MIAHVDKVKNITKACVAMHNFLMKDNFERYCPSNPAETELTDVNGLSSLSGQGSRNYTFAAKNVRDRYKD